jgi:hypothetical protein
MKPIKIAAAVLAVIVAAALGLSVLFTSPAPDENVPATEFSALRAAEDIKVIARDIHTNNDTEAITAVREYLVNTLKDIGLEVETRTYEKDYEKAELGHETHVTAVDICGTLRGDTGRSILLVAHYDSNPGLKLGRAPGSHGASDDAYGVSVILETLRCIAKQGNIRNTIRVVFTDAEETAMLGSEAIAEDTAFNAASSDAVFNIESRGLSGPSILFETSANNEGLVRFYNAYNPHPASWSLATDVYRIMPNYTDFTAFIDQGMQGLNFSNLYKIDDNHTPRDIYENISLSALQDYGEQVLPLVRAFALGNAPDSFKSTQDMAWFTLVRGVLVSFPAWTNWVWLSLDALLLAAYVHMAHRRGKMKLRHLLRAFVYLGTAIATAAIGTGIAWLLAQLFDRPFILMGLTGVPGFGWITVALTAAIYILLTLYMRRRIRKGNTFEEMAIPAILLAAVLAAVFTIMLPGGAFLFSFGVIFASIFGLIALRHPVFSLFTGFLSVWIAAPVVALLLIALTPGALGIVLMFASFPLFIAAPSLAAAMAEIKAKAAQA